MVIRTGILGGTFDPPHLGHLEMARAAMEHLKLQEVIWIPANRNPLKNRKTSPGNIRMEMVSRAIGDTPDYSLSDIEVSRGGASYMVDTLDELQMVSPGRAWWIILGTDSLRTLMDWKDLDRLAKLSRFAVVARSQDQVESLKGKLPPEIARRVETVPMPRMEISSTNIRAEIAVGKSVEHWLSPEVWEYIREKGLYQQVKTD